MEAKLQITVISNHGRIIECIKCYHIDGCKSNTVFYRDESYKNEHSVRIYEELVNIQIQPKKIILHYPLCTAEIIKI